MSINNRRKDTLERLRSHFVNAPDDWMSLEDIAVKFDTTERYAATLIGKLREEGMSIQARTVYYRGADGAQKP